MWIISLEDANLFDHHHQSGGVDATGGKNINLDYTFNTATPVSLVMHIFAIYDVHFSIENNVVGVIKQTNQVSA